MKADFRLPIVEMLINTHSIAHAIPSASEGQTPLQLKLAQFSKILTFIVLGICVFLFG